jgi:hypothetical protein
MALVSRTAILYPVDVVDAEIVLEAPISRQGQLD